MVAEEEALLPPEPAWLSRTENGVVDTYRLEGAVFTLGRSRSNDAVIRGASVSRLHAVIRRLGDAFVIEDTSSGGGIKVNGEKVTRRKLVDGDKIRLEAAYFEFISPP